MWLVPAFKPLLSVCIQLPRAPLSAHQFVFLLQSQDSLTHYYSKFKKMQRRQFGLDLENPETFDFYDVGFNPHLLQTPRREDPSDSYSFRNYSSKDNHMFSSPLRRAFAVGQPTPMGHFASLGFTPWTPKESGTYNIQMSSSKTELNHHQILNFDEQQQGNYASTPAKKKRVIRPQSLESIYETPANRTKRKDIGLSLKRTERKRKEIELVDYVKTEESKCYRGLRNLASSVKQITNKLGVATAKEIAQALTKQLEEQKQIAPNSRQQQNIKRRVYDALKVLVSADVLIRDNDKKLIARPSPAKNSTLETTYNTLKEKVALAKKSIEEKSQKAILLNNKWVVGQQLVEQNKNNPGDEDQRIYFPFVGIYTAQENLDYIKTNKEEGTTSIGLQKGNVRLVGDIDLVLQLRIMQERTKALEGQKQRAEKEERNMPANEGGKIKNPQRL